MMISKLKMLGAAALVDILKLSITGPKVGRIAVSTTSAKGRWFPHDLREPAQNVTPIVGSGLAVYVVNGFTAWSDKPHWDVLELPPGSHPVPSIDSNGIRVDQGSHIDLFDASGMWTDIDTNQILNK